MNWNPLTHTASVHQLIERSHEVPCLIFKHSSRCSLSSIAKFRLESGWSDMIESMAPYFLDLISYREVSDHIAEVFGVRHESPQVILVWKGNHILEASHLDISLQEIREALAARNLS